MCFWCQSVIGQDDAGRWIHRDWGTSRCLDVFGFRREAEPPDRGRRATLQPA
jgi:hypothetical protein